MWSDSPDEIANRLGWLDIAARMEEERHCISALLQDVQQEGYTQAVLLGMGGSSLAPEVIARTFGSGAMALRVLDSTHPAAVQSVADSLDPARTLFIVATKSGTTAETLSLFKFFYNQLQDQLGESEAGKHFIAITDAGTELVRLGEARNFRSVFVNDPNIGGRYSALSHFGLTPAALVGVNLRRLLRRGLETKNDCGRHITGSVNPGAQIGVMMAEMARAGRDKLTIIADEEVVSFADWLEQLIAESTGKSGTGIVPVVGERAATPDAYGADRLFVHLQWSDTGAQDATIQALIDAGHPVIRVRFRDRYDLGGQFFLVGVCHGRGRGAARNSPVRSAGRGVGQAAVAPDDVGLYGERKPAGAATFTGGRRCEDIPRRAERGYAARQSGRSVGSICAAGRGGGLHQHTGLLTTLHDGEQTASHHAGMSPRPDKVGNDFRFWPPLSPLHGSAAQRGSRQWSLYPVHRQPFLRRRHSRRAWLAPVGAAVRRPDPGAVAGRSAGATECRAARATNRLGGKFASRVGAACRVVGDGIEVLPFTAVPVTRRWAACC